MKVVAILLFTSLIAAHAVNSDSLFTTGTQAFKSGEYENAAKAFRQSASLQPASGTLLNLGLAEWQGGKTGFAILAWEQSLWLDPLNQAARMNLRFARKAAQIEAPDLSWNEVVSSWLPVNAWAWIAGVSLWLAVGMGTLPGVLRIPRAGWHQALASFGIMLFLLSVPAHLGVYSRSRIGFVLQKDTPLRLTPTSEAQALTQLAGGEPARLLRKHGSYLLVRTSRASGWLDSAQFSLICPPTGKI